MNRENLESLHPGVAHVDLDADIQLTIDYAVRI